MNIIFLLVLYFAYGKSIHIRIRYGIRHDSVSISNAREFHTFDAEMTLQQFTAQFMLVVSS